MLENFIILNNKSVTFRSDNIMSLTLNTGSDAEATRNPLTIRRLLEDRKAKKHRA